MIHIVFNAADLEVLSKAIEMDDSLQGRLIQVKDDYAVGPLEDIYAQTGIAARRQWWQEVLAGGDYDGLVEKGEVDDNKLVGELKAELLENDQERVWIWAAQNKHDVSGYYWLISQLKDFQGRIHILYLNNLPFINEKGNIFYPIQLSEIPAREFLKAKKLARPVTLSEFEIDPDEWSKLAGENKFIRILEGGKKLSQREVDFYDEELRKYIGTDWIKANKLIHQYLSKSKQITGDAFLLWRLKQMASKGEISVQGELKNMKDFEIKAVVANAQKEPVPEATAR